MKFGLVALPEAEGAILAHSMEAGQRPYESELTYRIAKGTALTSNHLEDLAAINVSEVTVAQLEPGDVHEDEAATLLAQSIVVDSAGQNLRISGAGAGRVNLYAAGCGVLRLNRAQIEAINAVDPMISIATVPDYHRVDDGGMVATIKIISYAVPRQALDLVCEGAANAMHVAPPVYSTATLIETRVTEDTPPDKGRASMAGRLERMGVKLTDRVVVPHCEANIAEALSAADGEVILVLTGSATSDPMDVAPEALRQAGGRVARFGMPVDPGNLLFLGDLFGKPVVGLPGCARSPALNGADWVLERVICGIEVSSGDIAAMGVGGLLKEIPTRPMPRRSTNG